ncbi:MAG: DUF3795 domain-containing protein [Patescibacteria group bacterium]|nr:DUF3795 domain-containing protein [Patescibacteria group bacterium]
MEKLFNEAVIASCGMNCGVCRAYLRRKSPCHGCRKAEKNIPITRVRCKIRTCLERKGKFCFNCDNFSCDRLKHLDDRYRTKYGMSEIDNLKYIRDNGIENFLKKENKKWISDQGIFCVHDKKYYKLKS